MTMHSPVMKRSGSDLTIKESQPTALLKRIISLEERLGVLEGLVETLKKSREPKEAKEQKESKSKGAE